MMQRRTLETTAQTAAKHGCAPSDRSLEALLSAGALHVDKPAGPTSHQVSAWARDIIGLERLGHGGTLDPFATGLLTLMTGKSMRITQTVLGQDKRYLAVLRFPKSVETQQIDGAFRSLTGEVWNVPPKESAVSIRVRSRTINDFKRLDSDDRQVVAEISCVAGTYIRTIARDLGLLLDGRVELLELRRTRSGAMHVEQAVSMQQLVDAVWCWRELNDTAPMLRIVSPIESLLGTRPGLVVQDSAAAAVAHGASLARVGVVAIDGQFDEDEEIAIRTMKDEVVAMARSVVSSDDVESMKSGIVARPHTVLMATDTYPRTWERTE